MDLVIGNRLISSPIELIINTLKSELNNGLFEVVESKGEDVLITCPFHKDGHERRPSCRVFANRDSNKVEYGITHCFTCGYSATLPKLISDCYGADSIEFGEDWLLDRFGDVWVVEEEMLPEINLNTVDTVSYIDEKDLEKFYVESSDYLLKRGISEEVIKRFEVGYNPKNSTVVFPVRNEHNKIVMLTARSTKNKQFYIESNKEKPVYLLYDIKAKGVDTVYVCESQINALTLQSWGYNAVALIGTGSKNQYEILKKSGIRNYILCFDGDDAGDKGRARFIKNMKKDIFISYKNIPRGKDVNDLTLEEFKELEEIYL